MNVEKLEGVPHRRLYILLVKGIPYRHLYVLLVKDIDWLLLRDVVY